MTKVKKTVYLEDQVLYALEVMCFMENKTITDVVNEALKGLVEQLSEDKKAMYGLMLTVSGGDIAKAKDIFKGADVGV